MKSEPSNYSECKFSAKSINFEKITGGILENFPGIYTMIFSKKTIRVVSVPKSIAAFGRYRLKSPIFSQKGFLVVIEVVRRPN